MRDIGCKIETLRKAVACSFLKANPETIKRLLENDLPKKDALVVARVAGIMAAKKTHEIIPYCHPLPVDAVEIEFEVLPDEVKITSTVTAIWKTGVEMEALTAVSISALTIYDMMKWADKTMTISDIKLLFKCGGKSGLFKRKS